jgi:hypothetical protein
LTASKANLQWTNLKVTEHTYVVTASDRYHLKDQASSLDRGLLRGDTFDVRCGPRATSPLSQRANTVTVAGDGSTPERNAKCDHSGVEVLDGHQSLLMRIAPVHTTATPKKEPKMICRSLRMTSEAANARPATVYNAADSASMPMTDMARFDAGFDRENIKAEGRSFPTIASVRITLRRMVME